MQYRFYRLFFFMTLQISAAFSQTNNDREDNIAQIYVDYNRQISFERLRELTILKAAELTLARGYTHFEFMYSPDRPIVGSVERQGNLLKDVYGNASESTFESFLTPTPIKEKSYVFVKFCNENESKCRGVNAKSVIRNLHP